MASLLSSPARLTNLETVALFKRVFRRHGASPRAEVPLDDPTTFSQEDRLRVVPAVFGLMPAIALDRDQPRAIPLKRPIREHLAQLGLNAEDDELIEILHYVIHHFTASLGFPGRSIPRKVSVSELRATRRGIYHTVRSIQNDRCAVCGLRFPSTADETLDHVLPWRLVGDPSSGLNWQLLCRPCNAGKRGWLSSIQEPQAFNWWYGGGDDWFASPEANIETRFLVLIQRGRCAIRGCGAGPRDRELFVQRFRTSGLAVADNMQVLCERHV